MTNRARIQRTHEPHDGAADGSGHFLIQHVEEDTMLPPAGGDSDDFSLDALGAMIPQAPPLPVPPAEARGAISGVYASEETHDSDLADLMESLGPIGADDQVEVAEINVRDLSLQPGNPFVASSLVPPKAPPFPWAKLAMGGAAAFALGLGAYVASAVVAPRPTPAAQAAPRAAAAAVVAAPAPQIAVAPVAQPEEQVAEMAFDVDEVAPEPPPVAAPAAQAKPEAAVVAAASVAPRAKPIAAPAPVEQPAVAAPAEAPKGAAQAALAELLGAPEAPSAAAPKEPAPAPVAPAAPETVQAVAAPAAPAPLPALTDLPAQPSRDDIVNAVESVRSDLQQCAGAKHGIVKFDLTVRGSGRVSGVLIDGVFKGTPEGSCMARAMRGASFPQFSDPKLTLKYPLPL